MNLIKIKSLVINLDNVTYWRAIPASEYKRQAASKIIPPSDPNDPVLIFDETDDPIVVIHFVGDQAKQQPALMRLGVGASRAFLAHMRNVGLLADVQVEEAPRPAPAVGGASPESP